jgi:hypothetical protein
MKGVDSSVCADPLHRDKGFRARHLVTGPEVGCNRQVPSDYRLSRPLAARLLGGVVAVAGLVVVVLALAVMLAPLPVGVLSLGVAGAAAAVLAAAIVLSRRTTVVRLDETGYRVRMVRGAGATQARWTDVEDVVATTVAGERCVVVRLRDGRTTTIPVRVLAGDADAFARDLRDHLDRGHGYRRLA